MSQLFRQFYLLMWKNFMWMPRHPCLSAFEIIYPFIIIFVVIGMRSVFVINFTGETEPIEHVFPSENHDEICQKYLKNKVERKIAYSPDNRFVAFLARTICPRQDEPDKTEFQTIDKFVGFKNEAAFEKKIKNDKKFLESLSLAVIFNDDMPEAIEENPNKSQHFKITLRAPGHKWTTDHIYPLHENLLIGEQNPNKELVDIFVQLGKMVLNIYETRLNFKSFPQPATVNDGFLIENFQNFIFFGFLLIFLFNFLITIKIVVTEKERHHRELMKIMGLPVWLQWLCLLLTRLCVNLITMTFALIMWRKKLWNVPVFIYSSGSQLFLFWFLYIWSLTCFAFFVSAFFSRPNFAIFFGLVIYFVTWIPYSTISQNRSENGASFSLVLLTSLLPNTGLGFGLLRIFIFERMHTGLQSNNLWMKPRSQQFSIGNILMIFLVASIIYMFLVLYLEEVNIGAYGTRQPFYYICMPSYWFGARYSDDDNEEDVKNEYFEQLSANLPVGIQLKNLSKNFKKHKAVQNLNLNIYQGQITILVGHNGAGKSTTMRMITGITRSSKGTVIINGFDLKKNLKEARQSMGVCLQDNILFDELTVKEHLYFFGTLKGYTKDELNDEIEIYLQILELKQNDYPKALSGGMKRKLCTAIALCGKSKVVILDEPSSGLDPGSRRSLWSLLQKEKQGRTILLSTHFMDEADVLGDRVAIIANGEIQCCGSSFFLKQKYGNVCYLILDVTPRCQPEKIVNLLKRHVSSVEFQSYYGSEIRIRLHSDESSKFEVMLRDLESNLSSLDIRSFGISSASLDEVFMKVAVETKNVSKKKKKIDETNFVFLTGWSLALNQIIAMFLKQSLITLRSWPFLLIQFCLPFTLLLFAISSPEKKPVLPPLNMSLDSYDDPVIFLSGVEVEPYEKYKNLTQNYKLIQSEDMDHRIFMENIDSYAYVKYHHVCGASFMSLDTATAWYNPSLYHSQGLSATLLLNSFAENATIEFINYPLPFDTAEETSDVYDVVIFSFFLLIILALIIVIISSFFIIHHIKENSIASKHLQFLSGVNVLIFWLVALIFDYIVYIVLLSIVMIILLILPNEGINSKEQYGPLFLLFLTFSLSMLSFAYLWSLVIRRAINGYFFLLALGSVTIIVVIYMTYGDHGDTVYSFLVAIPIYSGISGLVNVATLKVWTWYCKMKKDSGETLPRCNKEITYYAKNNNGIGLNLLISFISFLCYFVLLILIQIGVFWQFCFWKRRPILVDLEEDVKEEHDKIKGFSNQDIKKNYTLVVINLTKYYAKKLAVNGLCFAVKDGECFGLLGENGAGKTTTFKMLTRDVMMSYGDAFINGQSVKKRASFTVHSIGYCPQFDAIPDNLTVRETLRIYALIHGIPWKRCDGLIEEYAEDFELTNHMNKLVGHLSGGNKRKLSTILAIMGDNPLVLFDEPSSGMDPASKRLLWALIRKCRESGKCIILTSQSMEECEALCTRVAIMIKGNMQCLGSTQRLKNKFAQGYRLIIKLKKSASQTKIKNIQAFINKNFPASELEESFQEMLTYNLRKTSLTWSAMFGLIETNKKALNIEDYSLGQCSLEQVFLGFVKQNN